MVIVDAPTRCQSDLRTYTSFGICFPQELYKELSGAAAASYTAAGYRRTGERMLEKVADVLAQRGARFEAAAMVQRQARQFLAEGWLCLAAPLLLKLMAYHLELYQV